MAPDSVLQLARATFQAGRVPDRRTGRQSGGLPPALPPPREGEVWFGARGGARVRRALAARRSAPAALGVPVRGGRGSAGPGGDGRRPTVADARAVRATLHKCVECRCYWPLRGPAPTDSLRGQVRVSIMSNAERRVPGIPTDNPLRKPEEDLLERASIARFFAEHILKIDASEGLVVGVLGPWGAGKTSFVNLVRCRLETLGVEVLEFNPWMFSGAEQLLRSFFAELSAQMKLRPDLAVVGERLAAYGEVLSELGWLPVVGPWFARLGAVRKLLATTSERGKGGVADHRKKIETTLAALDTPIVVVLDDIDRLTTPEIRDVFKLVRLTANFANIVYIVSFDRLRVEGALAEHGLPGRAYIEKILQFAVDLPEVPADVLTKHTVNAIDEVVSDVDHLGPFDQTSWPDVLVEVIRPLIRNMRDVRRYALSVHASVRQLDGQVAVVDVLALEAIRVFLPDVFRFMHGAVDVLTMPSDKFGRAKGVLEDSKTRIDRFTELAGDHGEVVKAMIQRLFPAAQWHFNGPHYGSEWKKTWLRERRVAHEDLLRFYLERVVGEGLLAFTQAEQAWARMDDADALDTYLRSLNPVRLEDTIHSLEAYEEDFAPQHVVPGAVVLLNLMPNLPERSKGMFELDGRLYVTRVVYRLLKSLKDPAQIEQATQQILHQVDTLSGKLELITIVGHRENAGHKLVAESAARALENAWRQEVRGMSSAAMVNEPEPLRVLLTAKHGSVPTEPDVEISDLPEVTLALLKASRGEVRSQAIGTRAVIRSARLAWDALLEVCGDEDKLRARIEALRGQCPEECKHLLALADKYLAGCQPTDEADD